MIHRLAWHFGWIDVEEFAGAVPPRVIEGWCAYLAREPDIGTRLDVATGTIAASNQWPFQKRRKSKARDFMPRWGRSRSRSSSNHLIAWAASQGATITPEVESRLNG